MGLLAGLAGANIEANNHHQPERILRPGNLEPALGPSPSPSPAQPQIDRLLIQPPGYSGLRRAGNPSCRGWFFYANLAADRLPDLPRTFTGSSGCMESHLFHAAEERE